MTEASTTSTFGFESGDGVFSAQSSFAAVFDPVEDLVDGWGGGDQCQFRRQVLLE